jgi:hypothetical protein
MAPPGIDALRPGTSISQLTNVGLTAGPEAAALFKIFGPEEHNVAIAVAC